MTNPKQMETKEAIRELWKKFLRTNPDYDGSIDEIVDTDKILNWWLSLRQKELQELVKKAEEIVATEMDTKEFATILEFLACDDLAISIIKKLRSLLSTLTDETK